MGITAGGSGNWGSSKGAGFDAIVVGSGPGGATVALELTKRGWRVLVLEWGGMRTVTGTLRQAVMEVVTPGRSLFLTGKGMMVVRGITVGGSSIYACGTAFDPPLETLQSYGVDVRAEVEEAKQELRIAPLNPRLLGPLATRIMNSAQDLGYAWEPLPKLFFQDRLGGESMLPFYMAPSYEAKWNARMFIEQALARGVALVTHACAGRVLVQDGAAIGVEFRRGSALEQAFAPHVIVAAGGIGSPRILRASGIKAAGFDFFVDPLVCIAGSIHKHKGGQELPMQAGVMLSDEGYVLTDMMLPRTFYAAMTAEVGRLDRVASYERTLQIMVKIRDELGGHLGRHGAVHKSLTRADLDKLASGLGRAREILVNAGAEHIFQHRPIASHPGGTVKIGELVDADLMTEYRNLYVCDASVIPEPWGRPPILTLVALGKRLAKHLAGTEQDAHEVGSRAGVTVPLTTG